jgi:hypothetical protein
MAAGNRSAIPSDRYGDPPGRSPRLPGDPPWKIIAAIEQWRREEAERITRQRRPDLARQRSEKGLELVGRRLPPPVMPASSRASRGTLGDCPRTSALEQESIPGSSPVTCMTKTESAALISVVSQFEIRGTRLALALLDVPAMISGNQVRQYGIARQSTFGSQAGPTHL